MTQPIHSDPERLRAVVKDMIQLSGDLSAQMETLEYSLTALGRSWQDDQFQDFRQLVHRTVQPIKALYEELKGRRTQMESDIDALQAYQKQLIGE